MFPGYFLLVSDHILNLLPQLLLHVWMVDETEHHQAECGRGCVEPGEKEEDGGGDEADFEVFFREEKILVILIELFDEDINDVVSPDTCGPTTYAK